MGSTDSSRQHIVFNILLAYPGPGDEQPMKFEQDNLQGI